MRTLYVIVTIDGDIYNQFGPFTDPNRARLVREALQLAYIQAKQDAKAVRELAVDIETEDIEVCPFDPVVSIENFTNELKIRAKQVPDTH